MNKSKGFTIIELIVVIAIIAVLAAIVLVNVTSYIAKGKNAAIKGNLSTLLTNGAVFYDSATPSTFTAFDTNTVSGCSSSILSAINSAKGGTAYVGTDLCKIGTTANAGTTWCACSTLNVTSTEPTGSTFCVDSTGKKTQTTTACATECVAATGACL